METVVKRFDVWLVDLNPPIGSEISKTRPCLVISPDEINSLFKTVTVAAITSVHKNYPNRVSFVFQQKQRQIALDHIRSVSKIRLIKKLGVMDENTAVSVCNTLVEMFSFE